MAHSLEELRRRSAANLRFPLAAQPEIIRADQKDAYYINYLQDHIEPLLRALKGNTPLLAPDGSTIMPPDYRKSANSSICPSPLSQVRIDPFGDMSINI
ncbi:hypothetical protein VP01_453g3 [Puccinia sorghi]|uniref:Uncharacterized protein n=1 Tax=Puccinia sorghi TaxID=27349 RepID=A0A0L6UNV4_9BASI|nr:hypothetical protein VP01_453g3 [Puccinia sorghi]